jgi:hypothetical protein
MDDSREIIPLTGRHVEKEIDHLLKLAGPVKTERIERLARRKPAPGETVRNRKY